MSDNVAKGCVFQACGRPVRAIGLCQTHYKHHLRGHKLKPIAPKRAKRKGTRRFAGLSLTEHCVFAIEDRSQRVNQRANAVITDILESWARRRLKET